MPPFHAKISELGDITFPSIQSAARWKAWKEGHIGATIVISEETSKKPRTEQQNRALHLYLQQVADALNGAGLDIRQVLKNYTLELDWTKESVKEIMWRTAQKRLLGKSSTTELYKQEDIAKVYEVINRFLAKLRIESIPFPSEEPGFYETAPLKQQDV